mmetsp:Transcript_10813/g.34423  ORF Transcript_10813/g.34423 Transcript_10813/m.34423 type:complete len:120 (+) Transcript_10813:2-361(+)
MATTLHPEVHAVWRTAAAVTSVSMDEFVRVCCPRSMSEEDKTRAYEELRDELRRRRDAIYSILYDANQHVHRSEAGQATAARRTAFEGEKLRHRAQLAEQRIALLLTRLEELAAERGRG